MNTHVLTDAQLSAIVAAAVAQAMETLSTPAPTQAQAHTCEGTTQAGSPCQTTILVDGHFCKHHAPKKSRAKTAKKQAPPAPPVTPVDTYAEVLRLKVGMSCQVRPVLTGEDRLDKKATNRLKWAQYRLRTIERVSAKVVAIEDRSGHVYHEDRTDAKLWTVTRIA